MKDNRLRAAASQLHRPIHGLVMEKVDEQLHLALVEPDLVQHLHIEALKYGFTQFSEILKDTNWSALEK
jgi:hypothetical protein